jgi:hypothetical protein
MALLRSLGQERQDGREGPDGQDGLDGQTRDHVPQKFEPITPTECTSRRFSREQLGEIVVDAER